VAAAQSQNFGAVQHLQCRQPARPDNIPATAKLQNLDIDNSGYRVQPRSIARARAALASLPDTIGRLSDLTSLKIHGARLEQLPDQCSQLSSLRVLELNQCMRGSLALPDTLTALEIVTISGSFDKDFSLDLHPIAKFGSLQSLRIEKARVHATECIQFGAHCQLTFLDLTACDGLVQLPASFGNLGQLRKLELRFNEKLQRLPGEISRLRALTALEIMGCSALSTQGITALTNLRDLWLTDPLDGPVSFAPLINLAELHLGEEGSEGTIITMPADFTRLINLTRLSLDGSGLTGEIPALSRLPRLRSVSVNIEDEVTANQVNVMLTGATNITNLALSFYSDSRQPPFPPAIADLCNLRYLFIVNRGQTYLPKTLSRLSKLTGLTLSNPASDPITGNPDFIFSLTTLQFLQIWAKWPSRLPEEVTNLQQLRFLDLSSSTLLCGSATRLRRLECVVGCKWAGDPEHAQATAGLMRNKVTFRR
jgi:Leucine-rich repeat (LRR) protein